MQNMRHCVGGAALCIGSKKNIPPGRRNRRGNIAFLAEYVRNMFSFPQHKIDKITRKGLGNIHFFKARSLHLK